MGNETFQIHGQLFSWPATYQGGSQTRWEWQRGMRIDESPEPKAGKQAGGERGRNTINHLCWRSLLPDCGNKHGKFAGTVSPVNLVPLNFTSS